MQANCEYRIYVNGRRCKLSKVLNGHAPSACAEFQINDVGEDGNNVARQILTDHIGNDFSEAQVRKLAEVIVSFVSTSERPEELCVSRDVIEIVISNKANG